jgi:pimeloyl-ACP methyl ester carboxylesterase
MVAGSTALGAQVVHDTAAVSVAGAGPETWVLLSGTVGGVPGFRRLESRLLSRGARVVIVDSYRLSVDSADVSFTALARRLDGLLGKLDVTGARVIAHAHGAGIALRLAANAPHRVADLTFLDVGALSIEYSPVLAASLRLAPLIAHLPGGRSFLRSRFMKGLRENSGRDAWIDAATERAYTEPVIRNLDRAVAVATRIARAREPEPLPDVIARVHVPVTLLLGTVPRSAAPNDRELELLAPLGARLRIERLPGVGHFVHEEAPEVVVELVQPRRVRGPG